MNPSRPTLWQLFCRSFLLSATTVGGGFVIMSMMDKIYVRKLGWLSEEDMLDIMAMAQSAPGAVAVNASLLAGNRLRGPLGAVVSLLGCILPPFIIMCILGSLYSLIRNSQVIAWLLPVVRFLIGLFLSRIAIGLCRKQLTTRFSRILFAVTLTGILVFHVQSIWFLLGAALLTVIHYLGGKHHV